MLLPWIELLGLFVILFLALEIGSKVIAFDYIGIARFFRSDGSCADGETFKEVF